MPLHKLELKVGATIILLRNLNPKKGLCNGTRLTLRDLQCHLIWAKVIATQHRGRYVMILQITMSSKDTALPIDIARLQFPVRLAYCLTINKAQRQLLSWNPATSDPLLESYLSQLEKEVLSVTTEGDRQVYGEIEVDPTIELGKAVNNRINELRLEDRGLEKVTDFLKVNEGKLGEIGRIPEGAILCTVDVVGLYPIAFHMETVWKPSGKRWIEWKTQTWLLIP
eukprot:gene10069-biopygen12727